MRKYAIDLARAFERVFAELCRHGLLLESDKSFPSVAGLVVGGPIRGSWWAHPLCHEIYMVSQRLIDHPDALMLKLLSAKLTHVHRARWPELYAIATARERWQIDGLPATAKALLAEVRERGILRMDEVPSRRTLKELGADARLLEARLLVFGDDVHTESGAHVKRIGTWEEWAKHAKFTPTDLPAPADARAKLDRVVAVLNARFGASATLPWQQRSQRRRSA